MPAPDTATRTALSLEALLKEVEAGLAALPYQQLKPENLYAPMAYILGLKGKRMRPLLVLLAYKAFAESDTVPSRALDASLSVELFHNFTLIHDDIMDNAPTRRGMPTVHQKWDANTAILSGDAMFAEAMRLVARRFPECAADLVDIFADGAMKVCEGQMQDMDLAGRPGESVTVEEYLDMIGKKTAALLGASLKLGAAAAGASAETQTHLERYGMLAGTAFQLQDDVLDVYASAAEFGKQVAGDILENKKTYLWLTAYARGTAAQKAELLHWCSVADQPEAKIAAVKAIYAATQAREETEQLANRYFAEADSLLAPYTNREAIQQLRALAAMLGNRKH